MVVPTEDHHRQKRGKNAEGGPGHGTPSTLYAVPERYNPQSDALKVFFGAFGTFGK